MRLVRPGMYERGYSDIRAKTRREENLFIFAPARPLWDLPLDPQPGDDLESFYGSIINQELVHARNLNFLYEPQGRSRNLWWEFSPSCGQKIKIISNPDAFYEPFQTWEAKLQFHCTGCGAVAGSKLSSEEFSILLLHLALKNAVPQMNICNVIEPYGNLRPISFSMEKSDFLNRGFRGPEKHGFGPFDFSLPGFIPTQDPEKCFFFYESHAWLKLLFMKYIEYHDSLTRKLSRDIGGPRRK